MGILDGGHDRLAVFTMKSNTLHLAQPVPSEDPHPLLAHLVNMPVSACQQWQGWTITPITGGWNNLLYRTSNDRHDWAIKFTIRDTRQRARREFMALQALQLGGMANVPQPVLLDEDSYPQPVVVQSWLTGDGATIPQTPQDWHGLLNHYAQIHTITPDNTGVDLPPATLTAHTAQQALDNVHLEMTRIPPEAHHPLLPNLLNQLESSPLPNWPPAPVTLCRTDPNIRNFICAGKEWASVDWENAGWGDPAWEIADLLAHPAYIDVAPEEHPAIITTYCQLANDPGAALRIPTYYKSILVWWIARLARYTYDAAHNLNPRLASQPDGQPLNQQAKLDFYVQQARRELF